MYIKLRKWLIKYTQTCKKSQISYVISSSAILDVGSIGILSSFSDQSVNTHIDHISARLIIRWRGQKALRNFPTNGLVFVTVSSPQKNAGKKSLRSRRERRMPQLIYWETWVREDRSTQRRNWPNFPILTSLKSVYHSSNVWWIYMRKDKLKNTPLLN